MQAYAPVMAPAARLLEVAEEQLKELRLVVRRPTATQREIRRARIILERAAGHSQQEVARKVGVQRLVVAHWERRFREEGLAGLVDAKGRGRKPSISDEKREQVIVRATQPPYPRKRWTARTMARAVGLSPSTVQRVWSQNEIKPHLTRTFKLSNDPQFEQKFWDVIGLYLDPPAKALVLCCDEKSQCQAIERTQPGLPLGMGQIRTKTHDYRRHGTITFFAALNYLNGKLSRFIAPRHTHVEWLAFLKQLDREMPEGVTLHLIVDNLSTHKTAEVRGWIEKVNKRHRRALGIDRLVQHFVPTSSSWMNLVERFFRDITEDVIREGSFSNVQELADAIEAYLAERDLAPKRYVWKAEGAKILEKIGRARKAAASPSV
jgi:transposase